MAEEINMQEVVSEIKGATEDEIREVIEGWFQKTRTEGMKVGAKFISAGVFGAIQKHLNTTNPSLRSYERCLKDIRKIISVQLTEKNTTINNSDNHSEDDGDG